MQYLQQMWANVGLQTLPHLPTHSRTRGSHCGYAITYGH